MKLITLLLLISLATATAKTSYSQQTKFVLNLEHVTVKQLFDKIEGSSEFIFIYYDNILDLNQEVSVIANNETVEEILKKVFETSDNTFKIFDRQIVIAKKENSDAVFSKFPEPQVSKKELSGSITDSKGNPLPGVSIVVKGTTLGTVTDAEGKFILTMPVDAKSLVISFIGMKSQEIVLTRETVINVIMEEMNVGMDEVVVIGYGTQKKVTVTGSISTVSGDIIAKSPSQGVATALAGRVTGVVTTQVSGQPGKSNPSVYVRGVGTYTGASGALSLVDGVERSFQSIDPNEIESISILKDASATAVFGIRGANGVIIVTTKRGVEGAPKISFSANYGIQVPSKLVETANSYVYATEWNKAQLHDDPGVLPSALRFSPLAINSFKTGKYPEIFPNESLATKIFKATAPQNQENISISGGSQSVKYFISLGHFFQDGLTTTFNDPDTYPFQYKRYNYRANIDVDLTKSTRISLTMGGTNEYRQQDIVWDLYRTAPFAGVVIDGKRYRNRQTYIPGATFDALDNIQYQSGYTGFYANTNNLDLGIEQNLDVVTKGLVWKFKYANNANWTRDVTRRKDKVVYEPLFRCTVDPTAVGDSTIVTRATGTDALLGYSESSGKSRNWYLETSLRYDRTFGDHSVGGLLLYNESRNPYPGSFADIPTGYVGMAARGEYKYKSRYMFDVNLGYNGSENFAEGKRFGFFPSASAGWILTEESFLKDKSSLLNYFKLRASYGSVGNDGGIGRFLYLPDSYSLNSGQGYNFGTTISTNEIIAKESRIGNPDVTWEKAVKQNYGFDATLLQNRLSLTADVFFELRSNILTARNTVPEILSLAMPAVNLGKVQNRGFEVEMKWRDKIGKVNYNIGGNTSFARNKILFMDEIPQKETYLYRTGQSVGRIFGYSFSGFWTPEDVAHYQDFPDASWIPRAGDVRYNDLNNDGKINNLDQKPVGFPNYPEIIYSLSGGAEYKGFDISFMFTGVANVSRVLSDGWATVFGQAKDASLLQWFVDKQWTPETAATAQAPAISITGASNNVKTSGLWIRDASYLRLKNAEIGYRFSPNALKRLGMSSMRVYANGSNLLTWTKLEQMDPEQRAIQYPLIRIFNVGVNLIFK
ncbi:MAG: TonB-dependent receptor [Prolixibacteraceae bacterium]|nr:TonB-dependent receptor [Prolixibacteraceae bacterium]